jgi:hypothetical protein
VTKDELYPVIDEVLHVRWHPYTNTGSAWIDIVEWDVQLKIHELAEALCDAIVERMAGGPVVSVPAVNNLRALASDAPDLAASYAVTNAADLLDAIDAQVAAYMNDSIGSSAAIQAISRLLHPVGAPS